MGTSCSFWKNFLFPPECVSVKGTIGGRRVKQGRVEDAGDTFDSCSDHNWEVKEQCLSGSRWIGGPWWGGGGVPCGGGSRSSGASEGLRSRPGGPDAEVLPPGAAEQRRLLIGRGADLGGRCLRGGRSVNVAERDDL